RSTDLAGQPEGGTLGVERIVGLVRELVRREVPDRVAMLRLIADDAVFVAVACVISDEGRDVYVAARQHDPERVGEPSHQRRIKLLAIPVLRVPTLPRVGVDLLDRERVGAPSAV